MDRKRDGGKLNEKQVELHFTSIFPSRPLQISSTVFVTILSLYRSGVWKKMAAQAGLCVEHDLLACHGVECGCGVFVSVLDSSSGGC